MIRHIVLIRFRADVTEDTVGNILQALTPLCARLGVSFVAGRSESPEKIERGFMHGFTIDFPSWEALQTYADDPDHKAFGGQLVAHAEGGIDGILVFDLPF